MPHSPALPEPLTPPAKTRSRWWFWPLMGVGLLALLLGVALLFLDSWLRQKLEKQVATRSAGRYELRIASLQTSLWQRSIRLNGVRLKPTASFGKIKNINALPHLQFTLQELRIAGIGLSDLLRHDVVAVDKVQLDSLHLRVYEWPKTSRKASSKPLYQQLPFDVKGLRLGEIALTRIQAAYGPNEQPVLQFRQGDALVRDLLLSATGAADTQRIGYAATVAVRVRGWQATVQRHEVNLAAVQFISARHRLEADSLRVTPLFANAKRQGNLRIALWLPRILLTGLQTAQLARRQFRAASLLLQGPNASFSPPDQPPPALSKLLAPYFDRVQLHHLRLTHGYIKVESIERKPVIENIAIDGSDLRVDGVGAQDPKRILYATAWQAQTGRGTLLLDAPYYRLAYKQLRLSTKPGLFHMLDVRLAPTMSVAELSRRKHHQAPHVTLQTPQVRVTGFDFAALERHGAVIAREVLIRQARVAVAGDGRFPVNPNPSVVTPESLGKLPFRLDVRALRLSDWNMKFSYLAPVSGKTGTMTLTRLNGTLTNISNDPVHMTAAHPAIARASGLLQNACLVQATFWLPLLDPNGAHRAEGTFGPASITLLNSMTEPTRLVRFERGQIQHVAVQIQLDKQQARGTMWASYYDLKMSFLSKKGGADQKTLLSKVTSKLVNGIVIRDENPRRDDKALKTGKIQSARDPRFSVFSLWRQGVVSGLLNSIGVPGKLAKSLSESE
ncbi:hypothetical protein [Hymenobacter jejuensis]|uniref:DUF748 domain-containing protein n=1 Tax=Hymenobacter jejuensis TaxID=2502781 RepID=A0A5B8A227_9BACT|nr:hypothetical protein [Hymenobacter jejuensis]QDA61330.1 hypothetical protein FHG12_15050 [Hymenobacter jejuensis]